MLAVFRAFMPGSQVEGNSSAIIRGNCIAHYTTAMKSLRARITALVTVESARVQHEPAWAPAASSQRHRCSGFMACASRQPARHHPDDSHVDDAGGRRPAILAAAKKLNSERQRSVAALLCR
jgi:hypothetical protein